MALFAARVQSVKKNAVEAAIIFAGVFSLTILILLLAGAPPFAAFYHLFSGSLGSWSKIAQVLRAWIPLTLSACGLVFTFRIGLWNIGVEGQIVAGAIAATALLRLGTESGMPGLFLLLAFLGGALGGGIWASIAGLLKTKGGVNEIFGGLGLNFLAQGITLWLIFGPWKRPGVASMSGTEPFAPLLWLPYVTSLRLSPVGLGLAAAALLAAAWILGRSPLGLAFKGIGSNPRASRIRGLKIGRNMLYAMGLAGGCAGLAGTFQVTGVYHRLIPSISSNYGYLALLVVMLANYRLRSAPAIAFFFACLNVGSIQLPMVLKLDSSLGGIIQGALVLGVLLIHGRRRRKGRELP